MTAPTPTGPTRRGFLTLAAAAGVTAVAAGCGSEQSGSEGADGGAVTVTHAFGETTVAAPPTRVVSAGFTEADDLLAVGIVPIATTDWWGEQPYGVWPWARSALGPAQPELLSLADGIQVERIAALRPDLIVAINAGVDAETYRRLSEIAPTIPQAGRAAFFEPWREQASTIGAVAFQGPRMTELIKTVDDGFSAAGTAHPSFTGTKALLLGGSTDWENSVRVSTEGWRTEFLTRLGFHIPKVDGTPAGDGRVLVPLDRIDGALDGADVLIWTTESDEERDRLLAVPQIAALAATKAGRNVFTDRELAGAIAYSSVLSLPVVADRLPPLLAAALG